MAGVALEARFQVTGKVKVAPDATAPWGSVLLRHWKSELPVEQPVTLVRAVLALQLMVICLEDPAVTEPKSVSDVQVRGALTGEPRQMRSASLTWT
jgi:hypothetical protein